MLMLPEDVPDELVEAAVDIFADEYLPGEDAPRAMRHALAAVLPLAQAEAWEDGYDRAEEDRDGTGFWARGRRNNPYAARLRAAETESGGAS